MGRLLGVAALLASLGAACDGSPVLYVGTTVGTPLDVPATWQEHWFEHVQLLSLVAKDAAVALYGDPDVDPAQAAAVLPFLSAMWKYTVATYGSMGRGRLYVILHKGRYRGCHMDNHFGALHEHRDVIDCGFSSLDDPNGPVLLLAHMAANVVETTADGRDGSPAYPLWHNSKWAELYQFDVYRAIGRAADADRVYAQWSHPDWVDDFPAPGCHWFRDWFLPIWRDAGGAAVMARFFASLAADFPNDGQTYTRALNWGELVHFMSGAARRDLRPLATSAFGWPAEWDALYAQARVDFPQITY
jgi:hypothetical protein